MIRARGEVGIQIGERTYPLCLTLGALAEIEDILACDSLPDMRRKLTRLGVREMQGVLCALLRGGGVRQADRVARAASPNAAAVAVAQAISEAMR